MPRHALAISVFLASPSDVDQERSVVASAIQNWNDIHSRNRRVFFELIRFERSISAGMGADGQDVINMQVNDDYDLLIALFWHRLGSPTGRNVSGTVEEYKRALERYNNGEKIDIAFFFKDYPVDLRRADVSQVLAVQEFEKEVQSNGALTKAFKDDVSLKFEIDLLLDRIARQAVDSEKQAESSVQAYDAAAMKDRFASVQAEIAESYREDDRGLLEVNDDLSLYTGIAAQFLEKMNTEINKLSADTEEVTLSIANITKIRQITADETRPLISRIAKSMDNFSDFMENNSQEYYESAARIVEDIGLLINISYDFITAENSDFLNNILSLRGLVIILLQSMIDSRDSHESMMSSVGNLQRMSSNFNRARRRLIVSSAVFVESLKSNSDVLEQALREVDILIGQAQR